MGTIDLSMPATRQTILDRATALLSGRAPIYLQIRAMEVPIFSDRCVRVDDSMAMLQEMAEREDFQVWIERVGTGGANAIVMEAGRVKGAAVEDVKAAE